MVWASQAGRFGHIFLWERGSYNLFSRLCSLCLLSDCILSEEERMERLGRGNNRVDEELGRKMALDFEAPTHECKIFRNTKNAEPGQKQLEAILGVREK